MIPYATVFTLMAAHKDAILAEGVRQAQTIAGAAKPTAEQIRAATFGYAKATANAWILPGAVTQLSAIVKAYLGSAGARPTSPADAPDAVAWRENFDQFVMDSLGEDTCRAASQDFLGEYMTDTEIDNPEVLQNAAKIMTDRLVEAAVKARTAGQVLAEIGIVAEDIAPYALPEGAAAAAVANAPVIDEATARAHVERLVGAYAIKLGAAGYDAAAVTELLKLAFDTEEFLALGSIEQLGGSRADWPFFHAYAKASPSHLADTVTASFMAAMTGAVTPPVTPAKAAKPKKLTKKEQKAQAAVAAVAAVTPPAANPAASKDTAGDDFAETIKMLHAHRLETDEKLGELIGVSRGTILNIVKKGRGCKLTPLQRQNLANLITARLAGLQTALTSLQ